ncbi:MAG: toprim domain-containing protein [Alistipes sp.]|nr:toprim domain-containing protein [Alistipes sp.]
MENNSNIAELKRISIRHYLSRRGINPQTVKPGYGFYFSPLRKETDPSFKVDWNANLWHDFGTGEGGSIIDLVARMENCSVADAIHRLEKEIPDSERVSTNRQLSVPDQSRIEIFSVGKLQHLVLLQYLSDRGIDLPAAQKYCNEVRYQSGSHPYFAIGFKNDAGGWELRNRAFKGSSTPKNITTIDNGSDTVMVFEGFMDFLSYLSLKNSPSPSIDTTVLNSVVNLQKAVPFLESHRTVHAFLDNDESGRKTVAEIDKLLPKSEVVDQSKFYQNYKDLNDYLRNNRTHKSQPKCPVRKKAGRKL